MELRKITAIIRNTVLQKVEQRLQEIRVKGISVSRVKGYGDYANFSKANWLTSHARIEIFASKEEVGGIVEAIMDSAHTGLSGDGLLAVLPVEEIFRIKEQSKIPSAAI
jgi:nitrogen regulatory protein P-II 1